MTLSRTTYIDKKNFDCIRYSFLVWAVTIMIGSVVLSVSLAADVWPLKERDILGIVQVFLAYFVISVLFSLPALLLFGFSLKWLLDISQSVIVFKGLAVFLVLLLIFLTQWPLTNGKFAIHPLNYSYFTGALLAIFIIKPE